MCKRAVVWFTTNEKDNKILEELLSQVEGFIKIERVTSGVGLLNPAALPTIQTDEGLNYYGLERAKDFVRRELALRNYPGVKYP